MEPTLFEGDRLIVEGLREGSRALRVGNLVVLRDPDQPRRWLVKRVAAVGPGRFWVFRDRLVPVLESDVLEHRVSEGAVEIIDLPNNVVYVLSDRLVGARDSRRFGAVPLDSVVGRATQRTTPRERAGTL